MSSRRHAVGKPPRVRTETRRSAASPKSRGWQYLEKSGIWVSSYGIPKEYCESFLKILLTTSRYYRRVFGKHSVGALELNAQRKRLLPHRLWTNGSDRIYLTLNSNRLLEPPHRSGTFNIHGLAHELAHIVLYRSLINIQELPSGWGEGWAVYIASFLAVPHLYQLFGDTLWPYPYNYLDTEGPRRYVSRMRNTLARKKDPVLRTMHDLNTLREQWGTKKFQLFFRELLRNPVRSDRFIENVIAVLQRSE